MPVRLLALLLLLLTPAPFASGEQAASPVSVKLLAINDFHGQLEAPVGPSGEIAGGAPYLAAHVATLQAAHPHTLFVSAGDLINASPFISALFQDEPTIEAMNEMGLALNAVGNHEFDEGMEELRRMQAGGCHPAQGCRFKEQFPGARFEFLAANVVNEATGQTLFPAYSVRDFDGVRMAFIGMTLEATGSMVNAEGVSGWKFRNEWRTANELVPRIRAQGIEAIVLLIHEGGFTTGDYNDCPGLSGPIVSILHRLDPAIDVVITGHTHRAYVCRLDGRLVTSAGALGRMFTEIDLTIDRGSGQVTRAIARNRVVTHDLAPHPVVAALVDRARRAAVPHDRISGQLTAPATRIGQLARDILAGASGESALGRLVADAQLWATARPDGARAQIAFMNPGGLREDLAPGPGGAVRYSQLFAVHPFGNRLVTMTLSGAQIRELLEQQFRGYSNAQPYERILQPSRGLSYTWSAQAPPGRRVQDMRLNGVALDPDRRYRVTVNSFLASGGDKFSVLLQGTERQVGMVDVDALEAYFRGASPVTPDPLPRITRAARAPN
jgi:5'-nucleotidase